MENLEDRGEHARDQVNSTPAFALLVHLGTVLRPLRQKHGVPVRSEAHDAMAVALGESNITLVCARLAAVGYLINADTYRAIEAGLCLPKDPVLFLDAIAECLDLNDTEAVSLLRQLAFDILCSELGAELARELFADATPPAQPDQHHGLAWA